MNGEINHVDLKHISLQEKIHVTLPIHIEGVPEGVKNEGGLLEIVLHRIEVKALATNVPEKITVNVKDMHLGDVIHIKDLSFENIELLADADSPVVQVVAPKGAVAAEEGEEGAAQPEVIGAKENRGVILAFHCRARESRALLPNDKIITLVSFFLMVLLKGYF